MTAGLLAAAPSDAIGFVLQVAAVGGLAGTAYAAHARARHPDADTWLPVAVGGLAFAFCSLVFVVLEAVL